MQGERYPSGSADIHSGTAQQAAATAPLAASFDLVVLGGGSAAEELCEMLAELGGGGKVPLSVAVVESHLVGGECPYLACMPSKAMLASAAARNAAAKAGLSGPTGGQAPAAAWREAVARRDLVAEEQDDSEHVSSLEQLGVQVFKGRGEVTGWGVLEIEAAVRTSIGWQNLVISTGSKPALPPIEGLEAVGAWTSDDALTSDELPSSVAILGGGPVGCELAEIYASFLEAGAVQLIESAERLVSGEEAAIGRAMAAHLERRGVRVLTGARAESVEQTEEGVAIALESRERLRAARLIVATGRSPNSGGLGLERLGVELSDSGAVPVDDRCAVKRRDGFGLFALGDVNGVAPFTHVAKYQARLLASLLLGGEQAPHGEAFPRCVFTDPPMAAVGLTAERARAAGLEVEVVEMDLGETARADAEGRRVGGELDPESGGVLVLVADKKRRRLVGASAFGPRADEWLGQLTLAVRASIPLEVLADVVQPFPTYCEALTPLFRKLGRACAAR